MNIIEKRKEVIQLSLVAVLIFFTVIYFFIACTTGSQEIYGC